MAEQVQNCGVYGDRVDLGAVRPQRSPDRCIHRSRGRRLAVRSEEPQVLGGQGQPHCTVWLRVTLGLEYCNKSIKWALSKALIEQRGELTPAPEIEVTLNYLLDVLSLGYHDRDGSVVIHLAKYNLQAMGFSAV